MADNPFKPLTRALRLAPSTPRSRSQSPKRTRSPQRRSQFLALELDPLLSNLSPQSTLKALSAADAVPSNRSTPSDALTKSIANVSTVERAFGIRAALTAQKLREWYTEVLSWSWPSRREAGLGKGFTPPIPPTADLAAAEIHDIYFGSLPAKIVEQYENRSDEIRDAMDALDVEMLKEHVLNVHIPSRSRPISSHSTASIEMKPLSYVQLSDFTAVITATILQALPILSRLNSLLATWEVRFIVLRQIPELLQGLKLARLDIDAALARLSSGLLPDSDDRLFSEESFTAARQILEQKVLTVGRQMDRILDELEGRSDSLPENWIDDMEAMESDFATWSSEAQKKAMENDWKRSLQTRGSARMSEMLPKRQPDASNMPPKVPNPQTTPIQASKQGVSHNTTALIDNPPAALTLTIRTSTTDMKTLVSAKTETQEYGLTSQNAISDSKASPCADPGNTLQLNASDNPESDPKPSKKERLERGSQVCDDLHPKAIIPQPRIQRTCDTSFAKDPTLSNLADPPKVAKAVLEQDDGPSQSTKEPTAGSKDTERGSQIIRRSKSLPLEQYVNRQALSEAKNNDSCTPIVPLPSNQTTHDFGTQPVLKRELNAPLNRPLLLKSSYAGHISPSKNAQNIDENHRSKSLHKFSPPSPNSEVYSSSPPDSSSSTQDMSTSPSPSPTIPLNSIHPITPSNSGSALPPSTAIKVTSRAPYITPDKSPEDHLEEKISSILTTIPARIRLSSTPIDGPNEPNPGSRLQIERCPDRRESPPRVSTRPTTPTPTLTLTPAYKRPKRRAPQEDNPVRLYHLHRGGKQPPLKLFVRTVGGEGERVMVRVGGGWADLAEYLKEYVMHHGRRRMSESKLEVQEIPHTSPTHRSSPHRSSPHRSPARTINNGRTTPISRPNSPFDIRPPSPLAVRKTRLSNANTVARPTLTAANIEKVSQASDPGSLLFPNRRLSISSTTSMFSQSIPLGLAGPTPKSRNVSMSPESEAWVEDVMGQARKSSATLRSKLSTGSLRGYRPSHIAETTSHLKARTDVNSRRVSDFAGGSTNKRVFLKGLGKGRA
ncbi:predicted protein [Uncinocarpus reesii 1704]|uniref:GAR domain-containing protein n=1 Tax=Uncinocarpus reesii (strain UAMH 1704) TaxID=336963 RepID=C4JR74_UNCRE|nr:uncharacterized protein UREG_03556 [Uncinocarpus reesii 1704]EEP78710.1 predicted protein [Uncinocarpus reesii 1704]